jgi:hypothetical protein
MDSASDAKIVPRAGKSWRANSQVAIERAVAARVRRAREELSVALVQARDGGVQVLDAEDLRAHAPSARVDLDQLEALELVRADVEFPAGGAASPEEVATESEHVTEGGQRLVSVGRELGSHERAPRVQRPFAAVGRADGVVDDLQLVGGQGGKRGGVVGSDGRVEACRMRGRGVRTHSALACRRAARRIGLGRELIEARERLGLAVGVEELHACCQAVGREDLRSSFPIRRCRRRS